MRIPLTKLENIGTTIMTILRIVSPLHLLFLVRPGVSIVTLCTFYFYKIIGKLTDFVRFSHSFRISVYVTRLLSVPLPTRCCPPNWNLSVGIFWLRLKHYGLYWISTAHTDDLSDDTPVYKYPEPGHPDHVPVRMRSIFWSRTQLFSLTESWKGCRHVEQLTTINNTNLWFFFTSTKS